MAEANPNPDMPVNGEPIAVPANEIANPDGPGRLAYKGASQGSNGTLICNDLCTLILILIYCYQTHLT